MCVPTIKFLQNFIVVGIRFPLFFFQKKEFHLLPHAGFRLIQVGFQVEKTTPPFRHPSGGGELNTGDFNTLDSYIFARNIRKSTRFFINKL